MSEWAQLMEEGKRRYMAGEYPQATHALRKAAELMPESVETWRVLGFALISAGNASDATNAFNTAIKLEPNEVESHFGLGLVRFESGELQSAIESYGAVLERKPGHARAKTELVRALLKQGMMKSDAGDKAGGGALYRRAFQLSPGLVETVKCYTDFLIGQERFLEAFEAAQAAKIAAPGDPSVAQVYNDTATDPRVVRAMRDQGLA